MQNSLLQNIETIGIIIAALGYFASTFFKSKTTGSGELIDFYKKEAEGYRDMMAKKEEVHTQKISDLTKDFTKKISDLSTEVGELRGQLVGEKKQNERLEQIFQNRNPEMEQFMKLMVNAVTDQGVVNKEVVTILRDIHTMTKAEHDRDINITATVSKS
jgi:hypothetical protein